MDTDLIELSRYRNSDGIDEIKALLDDANIPYRVGSTATNFDITSIGSGSDPDLILSVRKSDYPAARKIMEAEFLKIEIPEDHYLFSATDDDLFEILGTPSEWSPFDVAHARRLVEERGIEADTLEKAKEEGLRRLEQGKPASKMTLILGWIFTFSGGLIGFGIAASLYFMKEKKVNGEYFTYDERTRELAKPMLIVSAVTTALYIGLWLNGILFG